MHLPLSHLYHAISKMQIIKLITPSYYCVLRKEDIIASSIRFLMHFLNHLKHRVLVCYTIIIIILSTPTSQILDHNSNSILSKLESPSQGHHPESIVINVDAAKLSRSLTLLAATFLIGSVNETYARHHNRS